MSPKHPDKHNLFRDDGTPRVTIEQKNERRAAGICTECGVNPKAKGDGVAKCEACRAVAPQVKKRREYASRAGGVSTEDRKRYSAWAAAARADNAPRKKEPPPPCCDYCGVLEDPAKRHTTADCLRFKGKGVKRGAAVAAPVRERGI